MKESTKKAVVDLLDDVVDAVTTIYTEDISDVFLRLRELEGIEFVGDVKDANIVLSYGGDGTLLKTFRMLCEEGMHDQVLLAGMNKGTVGFMANDMSDTEFIKAVIQAYNKKSLSGDIQERQILRIETNYSTDNTDRLEKTKALNEIVIQPRDRGKLFNCDVYISSPSMGIQSEKIKYSGDGVIISTASGSTAYNLSCGGPILTPNAKNIIITPICPFTMAARSVILPRDAFVQVTTEYPDYVSIDGMTEEGNTDMISICNDNNTLMLFKQDNFFNTIQQKLGWNRSIK